MSTAQLEEEHGRQAPAAGEQVGQLASYTTDAGERVFIWTDERFDIIAWIVSNDVTFRRLHRLYANAGPYATPYDDPDLP